MIKLGKIIFHYGTIYSMFILYSRCLSVSVDLRNILIFVHHNGVFYTLIKMVTPTVIKTVVPVPSSKRWLLYLHQNGGPYTHIKDGGSYNVIKTGVPIPSSKRWSLCPHQNGGPYTLIKTVGPIPSVYFKHATNVGCNGLKHTTRVK